MPEIPKQLSGTGLRVGVVRARFNEGIGEVLQKACLAKLADLGVADKDISICSVPGALEIPLALQQLANTKRFQALIALGAVIRGETYHFELVSDQSAAGILQVSLDSGIPIANGVLTTENDEQAEVRAPVKGAECAEAAVEMAKLAAAISSPASLFK